ncbi:MAG: SRPBCC family protein [Spirochaetota bacterium]
MYTVRVEKTLNAEIDKVFAGLADHENYSRFPGVFHSELLKEGSIERNGVGARRKLVLGLGILEEDIVAFEQPSLMGYQITSSFPFVVNHVKGEITLKRQGKATQVTWISTFEFPTPVVGELLENVLGPVFEFGFSSMLDAVEKE